MAAGAGATAESQDTEWVPRGRRTERMVGSGSWGAAAAEVAATGRPGGHMSRDMDSTKSRRAAAEATSTVDESTGERTWCHARPDWECRPRWRECRPGERSNCLEEPA